MRQDAGTVNDSDMKNVTSFNIELGNLFLACPDKLKPSTRQVKAKSDHPDQNPTYTVYH